MLSIGLDLGGTRIKGAIFDLESGDLLHQDLVPTRDGEQVEGRPAFQHQARKLVHSLEAAAGRSAGAIGVSAPGLARPDASAIAFMPGRLDGLENLDWAALLEKPVRVLNDAHAALWGEIWQGSARDLRNVIFLTLGTGVGGAAVVDGNLLRGHLGRAGHLGHISLDFHASTDICGTPGSLEDLIGNHNIRERSGGRFDSTHALVQALESGDPEAGTIWDESMRALAAGIASLINVLDPEAVVIGGGIGEAWPQIEPRLIQWLDTFEWRPGGARVAVRRASLGEWAGVYGAASFAEKAIG